MPCCVLQHPETKDFVPSLEAAAEVGEGRSGDEGWGLALAILEMDFHPNRIMFIFSAVPFVIHAPPPLICMKLKIVGICFFFGFFLVVFSPRDRVFRVSFAEF